MPTKPRSKARGIALKLTARQSAGLKAIVARESAGLMPDTEHKGFVWTGAPCPAAIADQLSALGLIDKGEVKTWGKGSRVSVRPTNLGRAVAKKIPEQGAFDA